MYLYLQNTHSLPVQEAQKRLSQLLKNIQNITTRHQASLITITVPNKFYLCKKTMREHALLGAAIAPEVILRNTPDSLTAVVTSSLGIPFYSATATLQNFCANNQLYYTYDGHFTPVGNKLFAEAIFTKLKEPVMAIRRNKM